MTKKITFEEVIKQAKATCEITVPLTSKNCFYLSELEWINLYYLTVEICKKNRGCQLDDPISYWHVKQAYLNRSINLGYDTIRDLCWRAWNDIVYIGIP